MNESGRAQAEALRTVEAKQRVPRLRYANDSLARYLGVLDYAAHLHRDEDEEPGCTDDRRGEPQR